MEATLFGMVISVRDVHSRKVASPIEVTLLPMVTEVSDEQLAKAYSPMEVTPSGIIHSSIIDLVKQEDHFGSAFIDLSDEQP